MKPVAEACHWQCRLRQPGDALDEGLVRESYEVFRAAFGFEPNHGVESVRDRLRNATVLGLLRDASGTVLGFACYSMPDEPLAGMHFLWGDGMAIAPAVQRRGLSLDVIKRACALFPGRIFGWMGGRSQNPIVFQRYTRLGKTFPFDATYADGEGCAVMNYLRQHVAEVRESDGLDPATGICPQAYRWCYAPDFLAQFTGAERLEAQLGRSGFNRSRGDAVIVTVKLTTPICVP